MAKRKSSSPAATTKSRKAYWPTRREVNEGGAFKIPNDYTPMQLVHVCKLSRHYREEITFRTTKWPQTELTGEEWLAWFRRKLAEKITARDPRARPETTASEKYDEALDRLRPLIGNRIIVDYIDPILGPRVLAAMRDRFRNEETFERLYNVATRMRVPLCSST